MSNSTPVRIEIGSDLYFPYQVSEKIGQKYVHMNAYNSISAIREDYPKATIPEEILTHFTQAQGWPVFYIESARSWMLVKEADVERAYRIGKSALGCEPVTMVRLATDAEVETYQQLLGELLPFRFQSPLPKKGMVEDHFQRGPYGEIIPPPLTAHVNLETAWQQYQEFELATSDEPDPAIFEAPPQKWTFNLIAHSHTLRLEAVIAGTAYPLNETETQLCMLFNQGALLSMRPLGREDDHPATFAPVLKRLGETSWQFGLPNYGQVLTFEANISEVMEEARRLYIQWWGREYLQ